MRYLAWPALVASLTLFITVLGLPSFESGVMDSGVQIQNPTSNTLTPDDPVQHRPPSSANSGNKTSGGPDVESDHSGINEKSRL